MQSGQLHTPTKTVGRYEILREIGRGGMAVVFLARQTDLERFVALKELGGSGPADPTYARRFVREARLAGSLSHPNIVTVYDYFEHEGTPYIAMEYVERGSLRPYVGHLTLAQIAGVLEGVLAGLAHGEQAGIVHRDLKPENLMVTTEGRVKIADFGIAKATNRMQSSAFLTATGTTVGTPTYMAPEQAMAQDIGPPTDLYSVGCIAFELFTGQVPFHETEAPMALLLRHVNEPVPPVTSIDSSIDPRISDWIERLLVKDPTQRTQSAAEAWDELEEIIIALLGPRWRREARLREGDAERETPVPLTPAPFESAAEQPVTSPSDEFETFSWGEPHVQVAPPPPVPEEPPPVASETTEAGFVTYVAPPPSHPPVQEEEARAASSVAAPPPELAPPPPGPAPPEAAPPVATPPPLQPAPPAPAPPPEPAPPAPPELARTIAPAAPPPPASPPSVSAPPAHARRRRGPLVLLGLVLVAAIAAVAMLAGGGGEKATTPPATSALLTSGPLTLRTPAGWERLDRAPAVPGLTLHNAVAATSANGTIVLGIAGASSERPSLLPPSLAPGATPDRTIVRMGSPGLRAYRYDGLRDGLTVFVAPTSAGVATVACLDPTPAGLRAAATLAAKGVTIFELGPSRTYARALNRGLGSLASSLRSGRRSLGSADTRKGQATAATKIAAAYGRAATSLAALELSPADRSLNAGLVSALGAAQRGYTALGTAARGAQRAAYRTAAARIATAERRLESAQRAFSPAGYDTLLTVQVKRAAVPAIAKPRTPARDTGAQTPQPTATAQPAPTAQPPQTTPPQAPKPTPAPPKPTPGPGEIGGGEDG